MCHDKLITRPCKAQLAKVKNQESPSNVHGGPWAESPAIGPRHPHRHKGPYRWIPINNPIVAS